MCAWIVSPSFNSGGAANSSSINVVVEIRQPGFDHRVEFDQRQGGLPPHRWFRNICQMRWAGGSVPAVSARQAGSDSRAIACDFAAVGGSEQPAVGAVEHVRLQLPPEPVEQSAFVADRQDPMVERKVVRLSHVHQLAGVAAEQHADAKIAVDRQRRQDDTLAEILTVGQPHHVPQVGLVFAEELVAEHYLMVRAASQLRHRGGTAMVHAAVHAQA